VYFWDVSRLYLTLYPACISPYPWYFVYPCIVSILYIYNIYLSILQQIHCIPLYPTVSSCIRTYLAVFSCIPLYLTVSHRLENGIYSQKYTPSRGAGGGRLFGNYDGIFGGI